jgi:hypothetical protein
MVQGRSGIRNLLMPVTGRMIQNRVRRCFPSVLIFSYITVMDSGYLEFVYDLYKSMEAHEINLVYEGRVTQQITKAFIALAGAQMEEIGESPVVRRKVSHVMVECLQNINRHADEHETGESAPTGKGIFMVSHTEEYWNVITGNAIFNEKVKYLNK